MTEWHERVPVVRVQVGVGDNGPEVYMGYTAHALGDGVVIIEQVEPASSDPTHLPVLPRPKIYGKSVILANGMWERIETEWEPVGSGGVETQ